MLNSPFICVSCGAPIDSLCTELKNKKNIKLTRCIRKKCEEVADPYIEREVLLALLDILLLRVEAARHLLINRFNFNYHSSYYKQKEEYKLERLVPTFSTKFYFLYLPLFIVFQGGVLKLIFLRDSPFTHQFYPLAILKSLLYSFFEQFLHFFSFIFLYLFLYYLYFFYNRNNKNNSIDQDDSIKVLNLIEKNESRFGRFLNILNEHSFNENSSNFSFSINNSITKLGSNIISSSPFNSYLYSHSLSDFTFNSSTHIYLSSTEIPSNSSDSEMITLLGNFSRSENNNSIQITFGTALKTKFKNFLIYILIKLPFILINSIYFSLKSFYFLFIQYNFLMPSLVKSIKSKQKSFFLFSLFFSHRILLAFFIPDLVKGLALGIQAFSDPVNPRDKPLPSSRHSVGDPDEDLDPILIAKLNSRHIVYDKSTFYKILREGESFNENEVNYIKFSQRISNFSFTNLNFFKDIGKNTNNFINFSFEDISNQGDPAIFLLAILVMSFQIIAMLAVLPSSTLLEEYHPDLSLLISDKYLKYKLIHDNLTLSDIKLSYNTDDSTNINSMTENYDLSNSTYYDRLEFDLYRDNFNSFSNISPVFTYHRNDNNNYLKLLAHTYQALSSNQFRLILSMILSMIFRFFLKKYLFNYYDFIILGGFT